MVFFFMIIVFLYFCKGYYECLFSFIFMWLKCIGLLFLFKFGNFIFLFFIFNGVSLCGGL